MSPRSWRFGEGRAEVSVPIRSRLVVNTAEAAIAAAEADLGTTRVLSYQIAHALNEGRLVTILASFEPEPWPVSFVYPPRGLVPQKLRAFLSFAAPRISDVLSR
jgi:DNA-binding transcriptional LysR family regulator